MVVLLRVESFFAAALSVIVEVLTQGVAATTRVNCVAITRKFDV